MLYSAISQVEGYWQGLYRDGTVPPRSAVDPRGMDQVLEFACLLERIAPGVGRIRLAGMHFNDLMGMEVRGMPLTAMFVPAARATITQAIESVCGGPCLADLSLISEAGPGRGQLSARLFLAPLTCEKGKVNRILGCLQTHGQIGRTPRRFDQAECQTRCLGTRNFAASEAENVRRVAFAEERAGFNHQTRPPSGEHPHLRLVHSAD